MKEAKKPNKVLGNIINCPKFEMCPLCYGCRAYSTNDISCEQCAVNKKHNVCNRELHKNDLIGSFIMKDTIKIKEDK